LLADVYNEIFDFTFPWYALISVWAWLWHPVLLRLWLGDKLSAMILPLFVPIIIGCCLTAISNISSAQLGPLNRVGVGLLCQILLCVLLVVGVYWGWRWSGAVGVAWAFLFSRATLIAQDLFVIRLVNAGGWFSPRTWKHLAMQVAVGCGFFSTAWFWSRSSFWQLIPACLHAGIVGAWIVRHPVRNIFLRMQAEAAPQGT
jgi:hypothetical protein